MKDRIAIIALFDAYEKLLTSKQNKLFKMYYFEDLTFAEIAQELNISKAAVSDALSTTKKLLINYETKLKILNTKRSCKCKI